ncbi:MAG: thioredoxin [Chitinivibrionales bacterium]|nr:thioredoxin [Chitinivibrionales bacterium]
MTSDYEVEITDANYADITSEGIALIDFWAPWCGPCKMQGPIIESIAEEYKDSITAGKCNVDENPNTAASLGIQSIPTVILYKDGKMAEKFVGVTSEDVLKGRIDEELEE